MDMCLSESEIGERVAEAVHTPVLQALARAHALVPACKQLKAFAAQEGEERGWYLAQAQTAGVNHGLSVELTLAEDSAQRFVRVSLFVQLPNKLPQEVAAHMNAICIKANSDLRKARAIAGDGVQGEHVDDADGDYVDELFFTVPWHFTWKTKPYRLSAVAYIAEDTVFAHDEAALKQMLEQMHEDAKLLRTLLEEGYRRARDVAAHPLLVLQKTWHPAPSRMQ